MLKICGDVILPCATPVLKVIVALSSLFQQWGQPNRGAKQRCVCKQGERDRDICVNRETETETEREI